MTGRSRFILAIVGACVVAVGTFFLAVRPRQSELAGVRNQVAKEEDRTQQLQSELSRLQQLQKNAPKLEAQLARYRELVPEDDQVANFIFQVQEAANQAGVGFVEIAPELPKPPPEGAKVAEVRALVGAKGGYFAIQDFFRRLYDLDRAVRIDNVTMAGVESDEEAVDGRIELDLTARVFFELPAGAPGAGTTTAPVTTTAPTNP